MKEYTYIHTFKYRHIHVKMHIYTNGCDDKKKGKKIHLSVNLLTYIDLGYGDRELMFIFSERKKSKKKQRK